MTFLRRSRRFRKKLGKDLPKAITEVPSVISEHMPCKNDSALIKTVSWVTAGVGALAIGLLVGRELRQRYKFNRRTPYDFYSHSGDEKDVDFGIGV